MRPIPEARVGNRGECDGGANASEHRSCDSSYGDHDDRRRQHQLLA